MKTMNTIIFLAIILLAANAQAITFTATPVYETIYPIDPIVFPNTGAIGSIESPPAKVYPIDPIITPITGTTDPTEPKPTPVPPVTETPPVVVLVQGPTVNQSHSSGLSFCELQFIMNKLDRPDAFKQNMINSWKTKNITIRKNTGFCGATKKYMINTMWEH